MKNLIYILLGGLLLSACKEDVDALKPILEVPATYDTTGFAAANTDEIGEMNALFAAVAEAKKGRTQGNTISSNTFYNSFNVIVSQTTEYYAVEIHKVFFPKLLQAHQGKDTLVLDDFTQPKAQGGIAATSVSGGKATGYLVGADGTEYEQFIEKGLFSAFSYYQAAQILTQETLTRDDLHRVVALYGAHPTFPNGLGSASGNDRGSAIYAAHRNNVKERNGDGYYTLIHEAIREISVAIKAGSAYEIEKQGAIEEVLRYWEKALVATSIANIRNETLRNAVKPSSRARAEALHGIAEAAAFLLGFKGIPQEYKVITDEQIDDIIQYYYPNSQAGYDFYKFLGDAENPELERLNTIVQKLQAIYGFTDEQIKAMFVNDVRVREVETGGA
jgi:hypothetical protein